MHETVTPTGLPEAAPLHAAPPKICLLIVAHNAAKTLPSVLERISKAFYPRISTVVVCDDASQDSTRLVALRYGQLSADLKLTVIRNERELGYGGSQKVGFRLAIDQGLDILVLLRGDGGCAPECLEQMIAPLESGQSDVALGSRMMVGGAARPGGTPPLAYPGNRVLTAFENRVLGTHLSELHSGFRAYSVKALAAIPFERNSDDFRFDIQILLQLLHAGKRIVEVPVSAYHGSEVSHVSGFTHAARVSTDVLRYWGAKRGLFADSVVEVGREYGLKEGEGGSHTVVLRWLEQIPPARVLDLGCSGGRLAERMRGGGHWVTGVDLFDLPGVRERVDRFVVADLDRGLPAGLDDDGPYDVVVAADVLEHLRAPERLLAQIRPVMAPGGTLIVSVPNISHWYSRGRIALGLFDYDQRGILDKTHVRFFTRRSLLRLLQRSGFKVLRLEATGLPLEVLTHGTGQLARAARAADRAVVGLRPTLFGYQFVCQCEISMVASSARDETG